jgi:hypothetical protein
MVHINYLAIIVTTILAFLFSALYYSLLNKQVMAARAAGYRKGEDVRTTMTPNKMVIEFVRTFVLGLVIAYAVILLNLIFLDQAALLALWLWVGFPVVLLIGSVIHEKFPARLAAIHAGDWLVKLLLFAIVLTYWR